MKKSTLLVCFAVVASARASGPHDQFGYQMPIVRVFFTADGMPQFNGTGTVIGNHNVNGTGYFCVLTADHVIATGGPGGMVRNGLGIAFGQYNNVTLTGLVPNNGAVMASNLVGRLGPTGLVDIAVLSVAYGTYDATYDRYVMPLAPAASLQQGDLFSSAGYGRVGNRLIEAAARPGRPVIPVPGGFWNGYTGVASDQTQRFYYNSVDRKYFMNDNGGGGLNPRGIPGSPSDPHRSFEPYPGSEPPDGIQNNPRGYAYDALEWDVDAPNQAGATVGEGVGYRGDSGAPYMIWAGTRQLVAGVHTYGSYENDPLGNPTQRKLWGFEGGGVEITMANHMWIHQQCAVVPEPGTLIAVGGGFALLLRRRIKKA